MGLDQNLYRLRRVGETTEREEIAYFRKVNFLHQWVVRATNCPEDINCEDVDLSLEAIAGLQQTCQRVLNHPELGPSLLPTMDGFFFGGTDYDESYVSDVKDVKVACEAILEFEQDRHSAGQPANDYVYNCWW